MAMIWYEIKYWKKWTEKKENHGEVICEWDREGSIETGEMDTLRGWQMDKLNKHYECHRWTELIQSTARIHYELWTIKWKSPKFKPFSLFKPKYSLTLDYVPFHFHLILSFSFFRPSVVSSKNGLIWIRMRVFRFSTMLYYLLSVWNDRRSFLGHFLTYAHIRTYTQTVIPSEWVSIDVIFDTLCAYFCRLIHSWFFVLFRLVRS